MRWLCLSAAILLGSGVSTASGPHAFPQVSGCAGLAPFRVQQVARPTRWDSGTVTKYDEDGAHVYLPSYDDNGAHLGLPEEWSGRHGCMISIASPAIP
jgi:hypothetical protein